MKPLSGTIVFSSGRAGDLDIWTLSLASRQLTQLTSGEHSNDQPKWSPDGRHIVFVSNRTGVPELWLMGADGKNLRQLTHDGRFHSAPCWSPDGEKVLCCANYGKADSIELWVIDPEGALKPQLMLSSRGMETEPCWSPDGRRILLSSPRGGNYDLWEYVISSKEWRQLTNNPARDYSGCYSPDGDTIAWVSERDPARPGGKKNANIYVMRSDNPDSMTRLTHSKGADRYVAYSPDGKYLVYCAAEKKRTCTGRLRIINLAGETSLALEYDRAPLEREIHAEVHGYGSLSSKVPEFLKRKFAEKSFFGGEAHPHWTK